MTWANLPTWLGDIVERLDGHNGPHDAAEAAAEAEWAYDETYRAAYAREFTKAYDDAFTFAVPSTRGAPST
jgi:hypothetical protein